jgi:DNA repair ATPase RecN
MQQDH